jgi:hypothetical protein
MEGEKMKEKINPDWKKTEKTFPMAEFKAGLIPLEWQEQAAFVQWMEAAHPDVPFFAVPNGGLRPWKTSAKGQRYSPGAQKLRAMGVKRGVPDLVICHPCGRYHGAYLEFKRRNARPSGTDPDQVVWLELLAAKGYFTQVVAGFDRARETMEKYLKSG